MLINKSTQIMVQKMGIKTLGELKVSGYRHRSIKEELRQNQFSRYHWL